MRTMFHLLALALVVVCAVTAWIGVRKLAERRRREEERAAAFMAETLRAVKKARADAGKS